MINTEELEKIKEYDTYILFRHKDTGIRECFLKTDLEKKKIKKVYLTKWDREDS